MSDALNSHSDATDAIILARITNDERPLRRLIKKFNIYTSLADTPIVPALVTPATTLDDARESFLIELASYQLSLKKSAMIYDAETRQAEEYLREKARIGAPTSFTFSQTTPSY